jgi:hypothetical protein
MIEGAGACLRGFRPPTVGLMIFWASYIADGALEGPGGGGLAQNKRGGREGLRGEPLA